MHWKPHFRGLWLWLWLWLWLCVIALLWSGLVHAKPSEGERPLLVPLTNDPLHGFRRVGTLASTDEICSLLGHPIFKKANATHFSWDGLDAAPLWLGKKLDQAGVSLPSVQLDPDTSALAEKRVAECFRRKERDDPALYQTLTKHFLQYLKPDCHKPAFQTRNSVDDKGNLIEIKVQVEGYPCIDFGYDGGEIRHWGTSTFALMLIWKEAHPVLANIFDKGDVILQGRLDEQARKENAQREAVEERRKADADRSQAADRQWQAYSAREKSAMEQVFNFATVGDVNGSQYEHWTEAQRCVMSNGRRQIDTRQINMTAFRIYRDTSGRYASIVSTDGNVRLSTSRAVPVDRMQNAWALAFKQCPGTKSRF